MGDQPIIYSLGDGVSKRKDNWVVGQDNDILMGGGPVTYKKKRELAKLRGAGQVTHGMTARHWLPWLAEAEKRLFKRIFELEPHLTQTDALLCQMLVRNILKLQIFDEYFAKAGPFDEKGNLRDPYRVYWTCQKNIMHLAKLLALTTETKVKLGIKVGVLRETGKRLLNDDGDDD